jgi:hypothetical protein
VICPVVYLNQVGTIDKPCMLLAEPNGYCAKHQPTASTSYGLAGDHIGDAGASSAISEPAGHGWPSSFRLWGRK